MSISVVLAASPVITTENVTMLQSVQTIDFDTEEIDSGWFTLSPDGQFIAVPHNDGGLMIWNNEGELIDVTTAVMESGETATLLDADFSRDGTQVVAVYTDSTDYMIDIHTIDAETQTLDYDIEYGRPVRIWMDDEIPAVWLETAPELNFETGYRVVRLPLEQDGEIEVLPSAPEHDTEAYVRIGRIPAPYAVTATPDGEVRLWNLQTGELLHEVELEVSPVFGRVNETTGRQMAWRDPESQTLQLLDFETGENTLLAELDGAYIQALMVTPEADVVLAVHIGEDPVVAVWNVETGEHYDLGEYRQCSRVPDLVQLSRDGTTLVIGCDTGLDIWQIREEAQ